MEQNKSIIIQKKFGPLISGDTVWITEKVSPYELYNMINNCESIRMCLCKKCKYYKEGKSFYCMKHSSVCITEQIQRVT